VCLQVPVMFYNGTLHEMFLKFKAAGAEGFDVDVGKTTFEHYRPRHVRKAKPGDRATC
jgi:hypothetical protein